MKSCCRPVMVVLCALASIGGGVPVAAQGLALDLVEAASGLALPVAMAQAGDGSGRLFVAQQSGRIRVVDGGSVLSSPFLDLSSQVACCGERGLLGLAFHPDYATTGELFVDYTRYDGAQLQSVVARFQVSAADPDLADPASEEILLVIDQPATNHNGGQLAFGPDGYLYVGTGDGGGGGDPNENGQDLGSLLGKVLRLDVDSTPDPGLAYAIPADNPFVGVAGARGEIWAYGLRNPWRFSFDRGTGDLWISDVGQKLWEEVDRQPAASGGGENYGWDCREGAHDYSDSNGDHNASCPSSGFTDPVLEYPHESGRCSVTGGYRYRGDLEPRLRGVFLYADFCTGEIFGTVPRCDGQWQSRPLLDAPFNVTAFGEDEAGEVYVTEYDGSLPAQTTSKIHLLGLAAGSGGPDLAVSAEPLDFGTVEVGQTVSRLLTLSNVNAGPEAVGVAEAALSDDVLFSLAPQSGPPRCRTLNPCLPPAASCTVRVRFQAASPGGVAETLSYDGNFLAELVHLTASVVPCASSLDLTLSGLEVTSGEAHRACDTLTAGPDLSVVAGGDLTLCGGTRVVLGPGVRVRAGGRLAVGGLELCPTS